MKPFAEYSIVSRILEGCLYKTRTEYLRMADANGKMRKEAKKSKKNKTRKADGKNE